jgi:hypothetical protein
MVELFDECRVSVSGQLPEERNIFASGSIPTNGIVSGASPLPDRQVVVERLSDLGHAGKFSFAKLRQLPRIDPSDITEYIPDTELARLTSTCGHLLFRRGTPRPRSDKSRLPA